MIRVPFIEITQPIGTFYFTKFRATDLGEIVDITPRSSNDKAIQRDESIERIFEIADYATDPDATFPTPIIISVFKHAFIQADGSYFEIDPNQKIGEVIDGQHRLKGLLQSSAVERFELPVILMFNLIEEEKAYVFSIINSKQTKVSMSLIYDLFALSKGRSPQKTAHEIARALNKSKESPFYNRLKMLGKKTENQDIAILSQGTFVKHLLELLSKNPEADYRAIKQDFEVEPSPDLPLRDYFIKNRDEVILKVISNLFNAVKNVFPDLWENPKDNILWKTTGFAAIIRSFRLMYKIGDAKNDLTIGHFEECFKLFKEFLINKNLELTSEHFPSNAQQQARLSKLINESLTPLDKYLRV